MRLCCVVCTERARQLILCLASPQERKTLHGRGGYEICPVCYWEDDGQDDHDADEIRGGPNRDLSLSRARSNYREFGASDRRDLPHVRPARQEEL